MENWEETVIEDTFPEAGEIYFLRPRGNPPSVIEREGQYGDYYMLKGMFWIYTDQDPDNPHITQDSPMIAHNFNIKPGTLHDFVGKWDDTKVFHCVCEVKGRSKRLIIKKVYKAPVVHSQPQTPPPTPQAGAEVTVLKSPEPTDPAAPVTPGVVPEPVQGVPPVTTYTGIPEQMDTRPPALPPVCAHPPLDRTYTNDTTYICGKCDQRVVVV